MRLNNGNDVIWGPLQSLEFMGSRGGVVEELHVGGRSKICKPGRFDQPVALQLQIATPRRQILQFGFLISFCDDF